jgi:hypothetical protein
MSRELGSKALRSVAYLERPIEKQPKIEIIPVLFRDSREFSSGDRFDSDCVRHHAFLLVPKVSRPDAKVHNQRASRR